ncbi:MAG: bifunctional glycosyltransferase family 2 protein/CDP-glycerol:glycerophosphate glycerophosphotransferase [Clostridiales bacterium]|nr:bifunctional glycosyltransferase family 2 protein/CDP-glycerol:glycerophosphate glycerophosphotransferase [Clostridiales bacterium]
MDFKYRASVIVPVFNVEDYLGRCIDSLISQTLGKNKFEVLLIDDGSTDSSPAICDDYASKYDWIKVFHIENSGVSFARNKGIENAQGKYIVYLDSDDYLSKNALKGLCNYFDKHYDEIDLLTYTEYQDNEGKVKPINHFRYRFINSTGIYDLEDPDYTYFVQTNMNIVVKNFGENNVKFDTSMTFHEDQKYIISILLDKHKIGYYEPAIYYYYKNVASATGLRRGHPYYIYEKTMEMWESFLSEDIVPKFVQAYFFNDFRWKLKSDVLWPYHYKGEAFDREFDRIVALLKKVDYDIIAFYPLMPYAHKLYVFGLIYGDRVTVDVSDSERYTIRLDGELIHDYKKIEVYMTRFHLKNGEVSMVGAIKCLALNFTDEVEMTVTKIKGKDSSTETIKLRESSLSIFQSKTKTNNFKSFTYKTKAVPGTKLIFAVKLKGREYPMYFSYPASNPFCRKLKRNKYISGNTNIKCKKNTVKFSKANVFNRLREIIRSVAYAPKTGFRNMLTRLYAPYYKKKHKIWIYCDSSKTVKDNAYYQFLHDSGKSDGITRYYVYNAEADIRGWFTPEQKNMLLVYGSVRHRLMCLAADKMITSFYGLRDILSYPYGAMRFFSDLTDFEVIYLQHGVLHANLPTMYSLDRMMLDREVISTEFEAKSLVENYGFEDRFLIKSGMPRYDHIDRTRKAEKKILFAPTWRKFLVRGDGKGSWISNEKAFLASEFYKNTLAFLTDERLIKALKEKGYVLDFKLHPNFRMYEEYYDLDGEVVRLADSTVDEFSYSLFITDFSSFYFDFVFLKRPILYFVPDLELFEAGLNHYRKLDIPFEEGFGELSSEPEKAVNDVIALLENNCVPDKKYTDRMEGMFFDIDDHCEALYQALIE